MRLLAGPALRSAASQLDADLQLTHAETTLGLARVFERLRAIPRGPAAELAAELDQAQDALEPHLDTAFAALIAMAVHRTELRNDLDQLAHHLDAGIRDRLAADKNRADSARDRAASHADRDHARGARLSASLERTAPVTAPRRGEHAPQPRQATARGVSVCRSMPSRRRCRQA